MRALVTGSTGFIGSHVAASLVAGGWEVVGFSRARSARVGGLARHLRGDLRDEKALRRATVGCQAVFHVGALYSYRAADAAMMQDVNERGTERLLSACRDTGVGRVVLTSSAATCGPVPGRMATECDHAPDWEMSVPYKRTKCAAEELALQCAREGQDIVVVNPATVVGPGDGRPTPSGRMVRDVMRRRMWGYMRDMGLSIVDVEDVARGHLLAFEHGRAGERYILAGENLTLREIFDIVADSAGVPRPRLPIPYRLALGCAAAASLGNFVGLEPQLLSLDEVRLARMPQYFSSEKAMRELGYRHRPAAEALRRAVAWYGSVMRRRRSLFLARPRISLSG